MSYSELEEKVQERVGPMYGLMEEGAWKAVGLIDEGRVSAARAALMEAIEEAEVLGTKVL